MKKYKEIYGFNVTDAIREGGTVLISDLESRTILDATTVSVEYFIEALDDKSGRFTFYEVEAIYEAEAIPDTTEEEKEVANESV